MKTQIVIAHGILDEFTLEPDLEHMAVIAMFSEQQCAIIYDDRSKSLEVFVGLYIDGSYTWDPSLVKEVEVPDAAVQQALDLTSEWRDSFTEMWLGFLRKNGYLQEAA